MKLHQEMIKANGIRLNVTTAGEGRPILLLHGFPDTYNVWRKQFGALVDAGYRVIAPDLRGYGESDAPRTVDAYGVAHLRADMAGLLDAMEVERAYVVGHDWGSIIGWQMCMYTPERVECFAALSVGHPDAYAKAGIGQKMRAWYAALFQLPGIAESMLRAGDLMALKPYAVDDEQLAEWRANLAREGRLTAALNYYRANRHLALSGEYPPVKAPVLGIFSEGDPALTEDQMRNSASYVDGKFRYEKIEGSVGHWLQLKESIRVNKLLIGFGAENLA
jgi:pimeloyl-ACP methyl ester carboxylesterase